MSLDLLSVLSDRENYQRFSRFIKPETLSPETKTIVADIEIFFKDHPSVDEISWDTFNDWFRLIRHSSYKEDKYKVYSKIFSTMETYTTSEVAETIIEKYVAQDYAQRIADIALRGAEGDLVDLNDITDIVEEFNEEVGRVSKLDSFFVTDDIDELVKVVEGGYEWRMDFLNVSTGNVRPGKLILIAMRPETGKTTLMASELTYMASQMLPDECILWFNNEEGGRDVKMRLITAATGLTTDQITHDPKRAREMYEKAVNGPMSKIKVVDKADINVKDVEEIVRNHNVKAIVFDQLWKVHGFDKAASTDTARLGMLFQWARELAKKYEVPIIGAHQVKTEGEGVEYLKPSMLYLSGTAIQGEVDTLIMVGRNFSSGQEWIRFFNICKNKGAFGPRVDTSISKTAVKLDALHAKWEEM